ncbi:hypothetical protein EDB87DRAFT_1713018 [Lactarius vividus]|nr:hypothetical protein EDB87DRAFT_1713018 [Lactarius vividus]
MSATVLTRAQFLSYASWLFQGPSVWPAPDLIVFETPLTEDIANSGRPSSVCGVYLRSCFAASHKQAWQPIIYTAPASDEKMDPNFTFPEPSIPAGAKPPSSEEVAAFYLVVNSAQGPAYHPNVPSPRRTPSPLLPPSPLLQHSSLSPAFPMDPAPAIQVAPRHSPSYHHLQAPDIPYSLPHSGVSGAAQTWIPHQRNRACAPTSYYTSLSIGGVNGVADDSSDEELYGYDEAPRDGGMLAKSPPTPSIYAGTTPAPLEQTQTYSVLNPQLDTYDCGPFTSAQL